MPKRIHDYADSEKARVYRNRQRRKNYEGCKFPRSSGQRWTEEDDEILVGWTGTYRELSARIGRSVRAITSRVHVLRERGVLPSLPSAGSASAARGMNGGESRERLED